MNEGNQTRKDADNKISNQERKTLERKKRRKGNKSDKNRKTSGVERG